MNKPDSHVLSSPESKSLFNSIITGLIVVTVVLGIVPVVPYVYFVVTGWPPPHEMTHQGPLAHTGWDDVIFGADLVLGLLLPSITLAVGIISGVVLRRPRYFVFCLLLSIEQFVWGFVDFWLLLALAD